ncbi:hypothetical protein MKX01_042562 [Papaver californicum]|nr:hypothetical protein MKX01_042562 [Papaver californicum]
MLNGSVIEQGNTGGQASSSCDAAAANRRKPDPERGSTKSGKSMWQVLSSDPNPDLLYSLDDGPYEPTVETHKPALEKAEVYVGSDSEAYGKEDGADERRNDRDLAANKKGEVDDSSRKPTGTCLKT